MLTLNLPMLSTLVAIAGAQLRVKTMSPRGILVARI
jgi:hypothetical protein